jgi:hypothetical protein
VLVRERRIDIVAGFSLFGIVMSALAAVFSSDSRMLLVRESYCTALIGVVFLASAVVRRPILWIMAVSQLKNTDPDKAEQVKELINDPAKRGLFYGMTYLWGWSMILEVVVKIWMIDHMTPGHVLIWGPISTYGITGLTIGATALMVLRTRARLNRDA